MQEDNKKTILIVQLVGFIFISLFGSLLHFLFEISGNFYPVGAISAVNESVWEHLKMAYWPLVFFMPIQYLSLRGKINNYFLANMIAVFIIPTIIVVTFYSYTPFTGKNVLAIDLTSFFIGILVGEYLSYRILILDEKKPIFSIIGAIGIIILGVMFVVFTYFPPHIFLFLDGIYNDYGIIPH